MKSVERHRRTVPSRGLCLSGKYAYPTHRAAKQAAKSHGLDSYRCPDCTQYHLTKIRQTEEVRLWSRDLRHRRTTGG